MALQSRLGVSKALYMKARDQITPYILFLICLNITLQVTAFCLMKLSWIHAEDSMLKLINYVTVLAFSATFLRAFIWQLILKVSNLSSIYLVNAIVPSLLLLAGYFIFNEHITLFNMLGSLIVMTGLILLLGSTTKQ